MLPTAPPQDPGKHPAWISLQTGPDPLRAMLSGTHMRPHPHTWYGRSRAERKHADLRTGCRWKKPSESTYTWSAWRYLARHQEQDSSGQALRTLTYGIIPCGGAHPLRGRMFTRIAGLCR